MHQRTKLISQQNPFIGFQIDGHIRAFTLTAGFAMGRID
jgi:hypothetical protein